VALLRTDSTEEDAGWIGGVRLREERREVRAFVADVVRESLVVARDVTSGVRCLSMSNDTSVSLVPLP
jgi:hypothetical protein